MENTLKQRLETLSKQHSEQVKIRDDAQVLVVKLEGAYEVVAELLNNLNEESNATSTRPKPAK